jgi:hypothetical protein
MEIKPEMIAYIYGVKHYPTIEGLGDDVDLFEVCSTLTGRIVTS